MRMRFYYFFISATTSAKSDSMCMLYRLSEKDEWQKRPVQWSSYVLGALAKYAQKAGLPDDFSFSAVIGRL